MSYSDEQPGFIPAHGTMKTFCALLLLLCSTVAPLFAADTADEARLVAAVKAAFEKHDPDALAAVTCWDRVPQAQQQRARARYAREVALTATSVTISAADPASPDLEWKDPSGVSFRSNLPVTRHIKITFAPGSEIQLYAGRTRIKDVTYPVGEKDGTLHLLQPAPIKPSRN